MRERLRSFLPYWSGVSSPLRAPASACTALQIENQFGEVRQNRKRPMTWELWRPASRTPITESWGEAPHFLYSPWLGWNPFKAPQSLYLLFPQYGLPSSHCFYHSTPWILQGSGRILLQVASPKRLLLAVAGESVSFAVLSRHDVELSINML